MYDKAIDYATIYNIRQSYPNRILFMDSLDDMVCGKGSNRQYNTLRILMQDIEEKLQRSDRYTYSGRSDVAYIIHKVKWYQLPLNSFCWFRYQKSTTRDLILIKRYFNL